MATVVHSKSLQKIIILLYFSSIFAALFFHFIFFDHNSRGIHVLMGFVGYTIFFISDCVAASEADTLAAVDQKAYRIRICALVAAAGNCLFLLVATVLTFPHVKSAAVAQAEDAAEPPKEVDESSA
mgnify:CR=1 FL=1